MANQSKLNIATAASWDPMKWGQEIKRAKEETKPSDEEEAAHLTKLQMWTLVLGISGALMASRGVLCPIAMVLLCLFRQGQFTILAHHSLHGGWGRSRRGWYGKGIRRMVDWLDWILPEAWNQEHNKEHHYKLNELADPDLPDRNTATLGNPEHSLPRRYFWAFMTAATWKWYYYASNTLKICHKHNPGVPKDFEEPIVLTTVVTEMFKGEKWWLNFAADFFIRDMGPPVLLQYVIYPLLVSTFYTMQGLPSVFWCVVINVAGSEVLANLLQFSTIVTNHAGEDLWKFKDPCRADTPEFYLRSVLASAAYHTGTDVVDYFHGYLGYQAEHHSFPDLSPLHYQRLHPKFKKICSDHGVPYTQEPVWTRVKKTVDVMVGHAKMHTIVGQATEQPDVWMKSVSSKAD